MKPALDQETGMAIMRLSPRLATVGGAADDNVPMLAACADDIKLALVDKQCGPVLPA